MNEKRRRYAMLIISSVYYHSNYVAAFDSIHDGGELSRTLDPLRIEEWTEVTHTIDARLINPVNSVERKRGREEKQG